MTVPQTDRVGRGRIRRRIAPVVGTVGLLMSLAWWQAAPVLAATFTVTSTADSGAGSLREAIVGATGSAGADTIDFAIPGAGPHTITPVTPLPNISGVVVVDAEDDRLPSGAPGIVIDGVSAGAATGLIVSNASGATEIRGLQIVRFSNGGLRLVNTSGAVIEGNYIGTDGTTALGNGQAGLALQNSNDAVVGDNVIASNGIGILLSGSSNAVVADNRIGVGSDGTTPLGNTSAGISIQNGADSQAQDNLIGGTTPGAGNVIAYNGTGILQGTSASGNSFLGNSIHDNTELGINLVSASDGPSGVTENDGGDGDTGPNALQNFPDITVAAETDISGTLNSLDGGEFRVEVFVNDECDPSGNGEGATFLGADTTLDGSWEIDALPINGTFITATATLLDTGDTSEFSDCFEVEDGLPAPGIWVGAQGVSLSDEIPNAPTAGTSLASGASAAGSAQFTYGIPDGDPLSGDGESGVWSFFTTATADGTIQLPWRYSGFHAFFDVTVGLRAVVVRNGDDHVQDTVLLSAGPTSCCDEPSAGFDYTSDTDAVFEVEAGDIYGFVLTASNSDVNETLTGALTIGTEVPTGCDAAEDLYDATEDGRYAINPVDGQRFVVHCSGMGDGSPATYLELNNTGGPFNYSSYAAGGTTTGTTRTTSFTKLRFDPVDLTVDIADLTFALSTGGPLSHFDSGTNTSMPVLSMPYATAMACSAAPPDGTANINLGGTGFAVDDTWFGLGTTPTGGATFVGGGAAVDITANGFCGWQQPHPIADPFFVFNPTGSRPVLQLRYANEPPAVDLATPVLFASIARSGNTADLLIQVDGAVNSALDIDVRSSDSCTNGTLDAPTLIGTRSVVSDAEGYVGLFAVGGVASGDFVTVTVTSPDLTTASTCVRTTGDNDYWPKALTATGSSATIQDVIEVPGKSRWYKFSVTPGQQITVNLSGLPADYDLAVFKDIGREFVNQLVPQDADDLTKLTAEYAPSVFSPAVFSPAVFSPAVFSPDAYSPAVFSPAVFSPAVFSPAVFSPAVFSPAVFSPAVFSPAVFSPAVFSPAVFSPAVFSPAVFSPAVFSAEQVAQAFSSAQTRSLIGVSATPGTGDESVVVNTWNNTGEFYVRVTGHLGASDPDDLFNVTVTKGATSCAGVTDTAISQRADVPAGSSPVKSVILTDSSSLAIGNGSAGSLRAKLDAFAARPEVGGVVIDVAGDGRVAALKAQALRRDSVVDNVGCPFAMNLVAEEIKSIVDSYRANHPLQYVVVVGGDDVIPFFRYPDQSLLGQESGYVPPVSSTSTSEASLRLDYVLSQDAYGSGVSVSLRSSDFPVPGLAVGRLVETPAEIGGMLDAYTATNGVINPASSLVTGYDFLADAADAVKAQLEAGTGNPSDPLITANGISPRDPASWTATQLRTKLLGSRHDAIFLAGHFSANSALAADFQTSMLTTELAGSTVNLENALVFSAGCHSGYSIVDAHALPSPLTQPLDWAQAFARKRATLVAGTGYQYGDTDFLEYSERLYLEFTKQLRTGVGAMPVGQALAQAKVAYMTTTTDIRGIHEKALLEATLFGLPMLGVNMIKSTAGSSPATIDPVEQPPVNGTDQGLATADLHLTPAEMPLTPRSLNLVNPPYDAVPPTFTTARWLEGPNGVVSNPAEPAIPLAAIGVSSNQNSQVLRGVGFRGGSFTDTPGIVPLSGAPTTELRGVHAPFVSPVFYPMRLWSANYYGDLAGGGATNLLVTPAQHKSVAATPGLSVQRRYTGLDLELFYSSNLTAAALSDAPTIVDVQAQTVGADIKFSAQVIGDPAARVHEVWVTWTAKISDAAGTGSWQSVDLVQCVAPLPAACDGVEDSRIWRGQLTGAPANVRFVVQAASGTGLVSFDDNRGAYYAASASGAPAEPAATTLELIAPPAGGVFGQSPLITARLRAGTTPVVGKPVSITIGGAGAFGVTGSDGQVQLAVALNSTPSTTQISASFGGDDAFGPSSDTSAPFTIAKAVSDLQLSVPAGTLVGGSATATATLIGAGGPLIQRSVAFLVTPPGGTVPVVTTAITDFLGQARLQLPTATAGTYQVEVRFGSVVPTPPSGSVDLTDSTYAADSASAPYTVRAQQYAFTSLRNGNLEIYTMNPDGSGQTRRTNHSGIDTEASFSPDGKQIVFASSRTGLGDIYKMNVDGTGLVRLTTSAAIDGAPAWSPDGTKIAFTSRRDGNFEIYVMNASNGSGQTRLTNNSAIDSEPEWSPDGAKLSFTSTRTGLGDIYVMNANGSGVTRLTTHASIDGASAWSPDGTKIVFMSTRTGLGDVYVMGANGSGQTRLTNHNAIDTEPVWTIDGSKILFSSTRNGLGDIYAMNPDGSGVVRLTTHASIDNSPAAG